MIYSFDTSSFYNDQEKDVQAELDNLNRKISELKNDRKNYEKDDDEYKDKSMKLKVLNKEYKEIKDNFKTLLLSNTSPRVLRDDCVKEKNIITVFDSVLTRTLGSKQNELTLDIMVVETFYFEVLNTLIKNGFLYNNEKYVCFTASAGQIRTKKTVFIKEGLFDRHRNSLMCGLSWEEINRRGGVNINKYLAYLALCNSATDSCEDFNIDKAIVVDDFESMVNSEVDFIDHETYEIERRVMDIPIEHTDGCGMILPRISRKPFMGRAPWVKGLFVPFPFDKFIRERNRKEGYSKYGVVKDIYGKEHDILKEGIEIILTKSQFKMWKYYDSWDDYKEKFKKYNCHAGQCNIEEDRIKNAKINYQMLQTLTDMTDDELRAISVDTIDIIKKIGSSKETMLEVLGVGDWNTNKNSFQQALEIYPELLKDVYSKETLKQVKKSITNNAKGGKLYIDGKYTFISPDLYAFCERLILGEENPKGLLSNGEVSCVLYGDGEKLDCLRSPHLYREHALRVNKVNKELKRWFVAKCLYTSCHDPISKILQFDVDGDKALVCRDKNVVKIAERNMIGIVPLYYEMKKAEPEEVSSKSIYKGLESAYKGGNIGSISNNISKIWNSDNVNLDIVKILVCENNFVIDYAKTLYKPVRPKAIGEVIKSYTKAKVPYFFTYAKDKPKDKVEPKNSSVVNRLDNIIPKVKLNFNAADLGDFNYKMLMSGQRLKDNEEKQKIIDEYTKQDQGKHNIEVVQLDGHWTGDNIPVYYRIRKDILKIHNDLNYIVDVLIEYLYEHKKSNHKTTLWSCFGDIIVDNIKRNLKNKTVQCQRCGTRMEYKGRNSKYCDSCSVDVKREKTRERVRKLRQKIK